MTNKSTLLLAAIMFTDMVGYTAMMQEDEQKPSIIGTGTEKFSRSRLVPIMVRSFSIMVMVHWPSSTRPLKP
jgi:hypothetical protein